MVEYVCDKVCASELEPLSMALAVPRYLCPYAPTTGWGNPEIDRANLDMQQLNREIVGDILIRAIHDYYVPVDIPEYRAGIIWASMAEAQQLLVGCKICDCTRRAAYRKITRLPEPMREIIVLQMKSTGTRVGECIKD